jgi:hypothetical protein
MRSIPLVVWLLATKLQLLSGVGEICDRHVGLRLDAEISDDVSPAHDIGLRVTVGGQVLDVPEARLVEVVNVLEPDRCTAGPDTWLARGLVVVEVELFDASGNRSVPQDLVLDVQPYRSDFTPGGCSGVGCWPALGFALRRRRRPRPWAAW